jgi:lipopolysaccharide transport system ATP-binding protein
MMVRLAFAVQVQLEPDVLIVDEALAVGDALFQKRCFQRIEELRSRGVTLLFVSHDQEAVRTLTDRAVLLEGGTVRAAGPSGEVLLEYRRLLHEDEKKWQGDAMRRAMERAAPAGGSVTGLGRQGASDRVRDMSFGDLDAEIESVEVLDGEGSPASLFYPGDTVRIAVTAVLRKDLEHVNIAVRLRNKQGVKMTSWGVLNEEVRRWSSGEPGLLWEKNLTAGTRVRAEFECECTLGPNLYEVQATVTEERDKYYRAQRILHWRDEAAFFQVAQRWQEYNFGGVCDLRLRTTVRVQEPEGR